MIGRSYSNSDFNGYEFFLVLALDLFTVFSAPIVIGSTAGVNILDDKTFTQALVLEEILEGGWVKTQPSTTTGEQRTRARAAGGTALLTTTATTATAGGQCRAFRTTLTGTLWLITDQLAVGVIT